MKLNFPSYDDCSRTRIAGIKTYITEDHHQNMKYWFDFDDADLLHVDAHHDMCDQVSKDLSDLDIANFICPAVHYGHVSALYWLNPHSSDRKFQYHGSKYSYEKFLKLETKIEKGLIRWARRSVDEGIVLKYEDLLLRPNTPFILDIDLDAFCCHRTFDNPPDGQYDGVNNYVSRINEMLKLLKDKKKPKLITITRSQKDDNYPWVPPHKVDDVQEDVIIYLEELYKK